MVDASKIHVMGGQRPLSPEHSPPSPHFLIFSGSKPFVTFEYVSSAVAAFFVACIDFTGVFAFAFVVSYVACALRSVSTSRVNCTPAGFSLCFWLISFRASLSLPLGFRYIRNSFNHGSAKGNRCSEDRGQLPRHLRGNSCPLVMLLVIACESFRQPRVCSGLSVPARTVI